MTTTNIQSFFGNVEVAGTLDVTGTLTSTTGVDKVSLAVDTTNDSRPIIFSTGTEGSQSLKTDPGITYNPSTNVLAVTSNIGIGTSSPAYTLDVHGTSNVGALTATTGTFSSNFAVNTNDLFVDTATGRVGVGTTNPGGPLVVEDQVNTTSVYNQGIMKLNRGPNSKGEDKLWIGFSHGNSSTDDNDRARIGTHIKTGGLGEIFFTTGGGGGQAEVMRITGTGDVGIGTSSPSYKLDVHGTSNVGALTATTATVPNDGDFVMSGKPLQPTAGLHWDKINSRLGVGMTSPQFAVDVDGIINAKGLYLDGSAYTVSPWKLNGNDVYYTTGNVGVGTTTPTSNLHVVGTVAISSNLAVNTDDFFVDTVNSRVGVGTTNPGAPLAVVSTRNADTWAPDKSQLDVLNDNGGGSTYGMSLAVSQTRGDGIIQTFNRTAGTAQYDLLLQPNAGNVGIGTTTPAYKLDVHGSANVAALTATLPYSTASANIVAWNSSTNEVIDSGIERGFTEHPVEPMTDYTTYVEGHGTYEASASSYDVGNVLYPWEAFDNDTSTRWSIGSFNGYNATTGEWDQTAITNYPNIYTNDVGGTRYAGHWLQIKLPYAITLSHSNIHPTNNLLERAPRRWCYFRFKRWYELVQVDRIQWEDVHELHVDAH
jgi:hypothetical protein